MDFWYEGSQLGYFQSSYLEKLFRDSCPHPFQVLVLRSGGGNGGSADTVRDAGVPGSTLRGHWLKATGLVVRELCSQPQEGAGGLIFLASGMTSASVRHSRKSVKGTRRGGII